MIILFNLDNNYSNLKKFHPPATEKSIAGRAWNVMQHSLFNINKPVTTNTQANKHTFPPIEINYPYPDIIQLMIIILTEMTGNKGTTDLWPQCQLLLEVEEEPLNQSMHSPN